MWTPTAWLFVATATSLGFAAEPDAPLAPAPEVTRPQAAQPPATQPQATQVAQPAPTTQLAVADPKLAAAVKALQAAYEGTKEFEAKFTQRYTYALLRRTQESTGVVRFQKPGHMRWDYQAPTKKSFIVDGSKLWVHQPEDNTAMVDHCFKQDGLTASVAFLWGSGDIDEQFNVSWFDGVFGEKSDLHLALEPKQANSIFKRLVLVVDPKSHRVKQSVVVDVNGNVNQFLYDDLRFNQGMKASVFAFEAPKGTHVSRIPGSCDPAAAPKKG